MFKKKNKQNENLIEISNENNNENGDVFVEDNKQDNEISSAVQQQISKKDQKKIAKAEKKKAKAEQKIMQAKLPFWKNKKAVGILFIIASILLLLVSPLLNYFLGQSTVTVFVADKQISKSIEPFTDKSKIKPIEIKKSAILPVYITNENDILGSYIIEDLVPGEIISKVKVSKEITESNSYNYILQNKKALSIQTKNLATSVAASIKPGDIVSAYIYNDNNSDSYSGMLIPECEFVKVLSVSNSNGETLNNGENSSSDIIPQTVTLLVNNIQAEALVGADINCTIYLAICSRNDNARANELLAKQDSLFTLENQDNAYTESEESEIYND